MDVISRGADGYYHPSTETELQQLVLLAGERAVQLRVRGSAHSVAKAIYTDGYDGSGGEPPKGGVDVLLDRYIGVRITPDAADARHASVEVEAGCHLGRDPYDPTKTSTWENSLDYQLHRAGYALDDLGGISHQTISGFLSTGSSGGSLKYSFHDNIVRLRLIDGTGRIHDVARDDPDPANRALFEAAGVSMGLLGVISKVWLRVGPTFDVFGQQTTTTADAAAIDLFGDGVPGKPSFAEFLRDAPYTRLMWWPQRGFDRIQVWQAARLEPMPGFTPQPYEELGTAPELASLAGSLLYTLIGNLDDLSKVPAKLGNWYAHLEGDIDGASRVADVVPARARVRYTMDDVLGWLEAHLAGAHPGDALASEGRTLIEAAGHRIEGEGPLDKLLASAITKLIKLLLDGALDSPVAQILANWLGKALPFIVADVLSPFVTDGTITFWDTWFSGLPMDDQMDDQLWPTEFTELWIPVEKAAAVMRKLRAFYGGGGDAVTAYQHTGAFSCELYGAKESPFWLSPSYGGAVVRIDVFWFSLNAGSPVTAFYPQFWELLAEFDFRPHWAKYLPTSSPARRAYYRRVYPKLDAFLTLRDELDPKQVFLTDYWRENLVAS